VIIVCSAREPTIYPVVARTPAASARHRCERLYSVARFQRAIIVQLVGNAHDRRYCGTYLQNDRSWRVEGSAWKAKQLAAIPEKNFLHP
jgi:hypothetical protein